MKLKKGGLPQPRLTCCLSTTLRDNKVDTQQKAFCFSMLRENKADKLDLPLQYKALMYTASDMQCKLCKVCPAAALWAQPSHTHHQ